MGELCTLNVMKFVARLRLTKDRSEGFDARVCFQYLLRQSITIAVNETFEFIPATNELRTVIDQ